MVQVRRLSAQAATPEATTGVAFGITASVVPVAIWDQSGANRYAVPGTLTLVGRPVAGARLAANSYTLNTPTDASGAFVIERDQTILDRTVVHIKDASSASIGGRALAEDEVAALSAAEAAIETAFVIALAATPALSVGQQSISIAGKLTFSDGLTPVPPITLWGYRLSGIVRDPNGAPVEAAYVSISDDEGETWALSNQTAADGQYELRFFPIPNSPYTVRIARGQDLFTSEGELQFQPDTSASLDVVLDDTTGQISGTGAEGAFAPDPVSGAEYVGYLIGLAVDDHPVEAISTWPDQDGGFVITVAAITSTDSLSFFQERLRFFSAQEVVPGSEIPADLIPETLAANSPRNLPPELTVWP